MGGKAFALTIDEVDGDLDVHSFSGHETLSRAWRFDLVVSGAPERELERVGIGRRATIALHLQERTRAFHGVVARISLDQIELTRRARFQVRVVPRLASPCCG